MHHYNFHIKDYGAATAHLSNDEDLCYRRLIDFYYDTEQPIPKETQWVAKRLRVGSDIVASVLKDFFIEGQEGWFHARCDEELAKYHAMAAKNKANGIKGGRPKKTQRKPSGNRLVTQVKANQEPRTKNQEPVNDDPRFAQFWSLYPKKRAKDDAKKAWAKAHINGDFEKVIAALRLQSLSEDWAKDDGQYIPLPASWLNGKRWEDEIKVAGSTLFGGEG